MTGPRPLLGIGALAALVSAVWILAVWFGGHDLAGGPRGAERAVPLQRDVAAALPPVFADHADAVSDVNLPVSSTTTVLRRRTVPVIVPPAIRAGVSARLAVLRPAGHVVVVDLARGMAQEVVVDAHAEEIATLGPYLAVAAEDAIRPLLLLDPVSGRSIAVGGVPADAQPERLLPDGDALQVWGRGAQGWSGAELRRTPRGLAARRLPHLPTGVMPVAVADDGLMADAGGATMLLSADGMPREALPGAPLAAADDRVVRLSCRAGRCALLVDDIGQQDGSSPGRTRRIAVDTTEGSDRLLAPHGVASPDGRRIAVSLLLKYDRGWRPAVARLDEARIEAFPGVLPPSSPTDAYVWSPDGRWLFAPLGHQVGVYDRDGRMHVVDLGDGGPIIDMAVMAVTAP